MLGAIAPLIKAVPAVILEIKNYEVEKLETITIHYLLKLSVFVQ